MTQKERDRLVALKKAKKRLITQREAAAEIGIGERQVRRLLRSLRRRGDRAVVHAGRGRRSNGKIADEKRREAIQILSQKVYQGFGPTLAAEYLAKKHRVKVSRETLRGWMITAKLWRARPKCIEKVHTWRGAAAGESWCNGIPASTNGWEGRGPKLYLISMIDAATSHMLARFVEHDSTEENMRLLAMYMERHGRPLSFYTDKAALFATTPKTKRDELAGKDRAELPPTQIGRALKELDIEWIAAHSPQAKGRVERGFGTAQDRLVKGLRVAGAQTLEQANDYLKKEFLAWWNQTLTVRPAVADNAHRPLSKQHSLPASLSQVQTRQVANDYTLREQVVSDCARRRSCRFAGRHGARGKAPRWQFVGTFPESLSNHQRMCASAQSRSRKTGSSACAQIRPAQKRLDEELSARQERLARENLQAVSWANPAQLSSRSLFARPPLQSSTRINPLFKAKPPECRGLTAVYSGANSIASALPPLNGRDPVKNQSQSNPELPAAPSKPDISTLQRIGHFYFALTGAIHPLSAAN